MPLSRKVEGIREENKLGIIPQGRTLDPASYACVTPQGAWYYTKFVVVAKMPLQASIFAPRINKSILFEFCSSDNQLFDSDNYAIIKHTGTLSEDEKNYYIDFIKLFMCDWEPYYGDVDDIDNDEDSDNCEELPSRVSDDLMPFTVIFEQLQKSACVYVEK